MNSKNIKENKNKKLILKKKFLFKTLTLIYSFFNLLFRLKIRTKMRNRLLRLLL